MIETKDCREFVGADLVRSLARWKSSRRYVSKREKAVQVDVVERESVDGVDKADSVRCGCR